MKKPYIIFAILSIFLIAFPNFKKIEDWHTRKRKDKIEFVVVHYTANLDEGADAAANARWLQRTFRAGTHYCIDDVEIIHCTDEDRVAFAVGGKLWAGFSPKSWLGEKISNENSLNYEMCLGGNRNDSIVIDMTAQQAGWQLANKGLDVSHLVRHYDRNGKPCPKFFYNEKEWNQVKEDSMWSEFKKLAESYRKLNKDRIASQKPNN